MIIISIGIQCTNTLFKQRINKSSHTLPFDWMLSTPKFVFEMLELLLEKNMNIDELVKHHFFICEKRAIINGPEHFVICDICDKRGSLCNTKYNVIFPHDDFLDETINKYIRRFERLKELILNTNTQEELCFLYSSQSSSDNGNFTINGKDVIYDVYFYLNKIYTLIGNYNSNYKMVVFDTLMKEEKSLLHKNIILREMNKCSGWIELLPQMNNYINLF
jgi:hypothetical protein